MTDMVVTPSEPVAGSPAGGAVAAAVVVASLAWLLVPRETPGVMVSAAVEDPVEAEREADVSGQADPTLQVGVARIEFAPHQGQEVARGAGRGGRERRVRCSHPGPELVGREVDARAERVLPEADLERDHGDPGLGGDLGRQVAGGVSDDRNARHGLAPPPGWRPHRRGSACPGEDDTEA